MFLQKPLTLLHNLPKQNVYGSLPTFDPCLSRQCHSTVSSTVESSKGSSHIYVCTTRPNLKTVKGEIEERGGEGRGWDLVEGYYMRDLYAQAI